MAMKAARVALGVAGLGRTADEQHHAAGHPGPEPGRRQSPLDHLSPLPSSTRSRSIIVATAASTMAAASGVLAVLLLGGDRRGLRWCGPGSSWEPDGRGDVAEPVKAWESSSTTRSGPISTASIHGLLALPGRSPRPSGESSSGPSRDGGRAQVGRQVRGREVEGPAARPGRRDDRRSRRTREPKTPPQAPMRRSIVPSGSVASERTTTAR